MAKEKTFKGTTVLAAILDRSGSMGALIDDMLGGYNQWLDAQKKLAGEATITTTIFDVAIDIVGTANTPIAEAKPLTKADYFARGMTAMNDAIGKTISAMTVGKKDRAIVLVVTDGQENSSKEWTAEQVKKLIADKEKEGNWTFAYLSSAPTLWHDAKLYGTQSGNTMAYAATADAVASTWTAVSASTTSFRSTNATQSNALLTKLAPKDDEPTDWSSLASTGSLTSSPTKPKTQPRSGQ